MEETKFPRFPHVVIIGGRTGRGSPRVIGEEEEKGKRLIDEETNAFAPSFSEMVRFVELNVRIRDLSEWIANFVAPTRVKRY